MRIGDSQAQLLINGKHLVNFSEIREMSSLDGFSTGNFSIIDDSQGIMAK